MSTRYDEDLTERERRYGKLEQGIEILHEPPRAEVDIVAVPGLGAHPIDSWEWAPSRRSNGARTRGQAPGTSGASEAPGRATDERREFNWIKDKNGLHQIFPSARIMLYQHPSAWTGSRKVSVTMHGICMHLLHELKGKRKDGFEITRPLILIGHSMGGVVIAKTLCMAKARKEFEAILTCTVGCMFFGAPFSGSNMASIALQYNSIFGKDAYESLITFMLAEKNDTLDELRQDFVEISGKLEPPIDIFCAWEEVSTDDSYMDRITKQLPGLFKHDFFKSGTRGLLELGIYVLNAGKYFVDRKSATLDGAQSVGLPADHRNLVKFESINHPNFQIVGAALSRMVQSSKTSVRKRAVSSGQGLLTHKFINQIRQSLEGVDMRQRFHAKLERDTPSSWLTKVPLYQEWLAKGDTAQTSHPHLWLQGGPGLGKTNASLVAIHHLEELQDESDLASDQPLLAYFLCELTTGCCTAEDLLKSLIMQIINQEESLAHHARWFAPYARHPQAISSGGRHEGGDITASGAKATATVDNLWKCLQEMIEDPVVDHVHFIISNMHCLDCDDSTKALLAKLRDNAISSQALPLPDRKAKWLLTSRKDKHLSDNLTDDSISTIDLENVSAYGDRVRVARQEHARNAVSQLRVSKSWSADLAWYIRNSIESRTEDERWIDVLCILLAAKPSNTSSLSLRKWLREVGDFNIRALVDHAWHAVLDQNDDSKLELEELLRALTIAYEPPSLSDLTILTSIDDPGRLSRLIEKCWPIIQVNDSSEGKKQVFFTHLEFAKRLHTLLFDDTEQTTRYHGLMALRCFDYIKAHDESDAGGFQLESTMRSVSRTSDAVGLTGADHGLGGTERLPFQASRFSCSYPIQYLFRHLSEGFPDVARELCEDDPKFWGLESRLRDEWLQDYQVLTTDLRDMNAGGMSALHVAAGIGAPELVSVLVNKNGKGALSWTSENGMTALHVAALNNRSDVIDTLIRFGADINAGEGGAGTALHFAALRGNCAIMEILVAAKANINALSQTIGPVINAAIRSGAVDAVDFIMRRDVRFDLDYTRYDPPLSLAAGILDPAVFRSILDSGREKWLQNAKLLDQALIEASIGGRLESVCILLKFQRDNQEQCVYTNDTIERTMLRAAEQTYWATVDRLLDYAIEDTRKKSRRDVNLDVLFFLAATRREDKLDISEKIWIFKDRKIAQDVLDFSLYQTIVMRKEATALWLLETCCASAKATAERPAVIPAEYTATTFLTNYWNVLNAAASTGNKRLIKALLGKDTDLNTDRGYALQLAAGEGHNDAVAALLEHGSQINEHLASSEELGFFSNTALQAACDHGRKEVVETLLRNNADPNLGGGTLTNPITAATQKEAQADILKLLLNTPGIDVNVTGGADKSTPLINAAAYMSIESVKLLLDKGSDVNAQNLAGDTALIMAASKGEKDCVELLCKAGADVTYRSPNRGLAIQVATEASHLLCAHVLAEQMSETIEKYRQTVETNNILAEGRLNQANAEMGVQRRTIDRLEAVTAETEERIQVANKEVENMRSEKERLVSEISFTGATYEAGTQRLRAMENERAELMRENESYRGRVRLADDHITQMRDRLDEEMQINADLRERQGYVILEREKADAEDRYESACRDREAVEQARKAVGESLALEQQNVTDLRNDVDLLTAKLKRAEADTATADRIAAAAKTITAKAQAEKAALQNSLRSLQNKVHEVEEKLAAVHAATRGNIGVGGGVGSGEGTDSNSTNSHDSNIVPELQRKALPRPPSSSSSGPATPGSDGIPNASPKSYLGQNTRTDIQLDTHQAGGSAPASPPLASPGSPHSPMGEETERRTSEVGWASVHGRHRPDGSLGGYRNSRLGMLKRFMSSESALTSSPPGALPVNAPGERRRNAAEEENLYAVSSGGRSSGGRSSGSTLAE